jgi:hypothetical protein
VHQYRQRPHRLALSVLALLALPACGGQPPRTAGQSAEADAVAEQLLAGARRAMGDVDRVQSLSAVATVTGPSKQFRSAVYSARDGRARLELGEQFLAGIGAEKGWVYDLAADTVGPLDGVTRGVINGHELHMLVLAPTTRWQQPRGRGSQDWRGEPALAVGFRDNLGAEPTLYLRARDTLPIGFRLINHTGKGPPDVEVTFDRWEEIDGVRLFRHAVFAQGNDRYEYDYTDIRLNAVADSLFEAKKLTAKG